LRQNKHTELLAEKTLRKRLYKYRECYLLLAPMLILVLLFNYGPLYGIVLAFKRYRMIDGIWGSPWSGFYQFERLLSTDSFWAAFRNTLEISALRIIFGFPAPIIFALLINELCLTKFKKAVQTVSYLPHFMSWVVIAGIMFQLFSLNSGPINAIIKFLGGTPISFMSSKTWFRPVLILSGIWQSIGWSSIIYLATITGIDPQIYEAARTDGANRMHMIRYITLPSMYGVISILFILTIGGILNAGFDQIFNLYNPMVYDVADIIDTYVYRRGFGEAGQSQDYSFATAVGLFKNIVGFILLIITNFVIKLLSENERGIW
jgi:putative aldouronate transport system permease protein